MENNFKRWLINQGYNRKDNSLVWYRDENIVTGKELSEKLNEYKKIINN